MKYAAVPVLMLANVVVATAQVPGGIEITCDVERPTFRTVVRNENEVTFRLWDSASGGSQCGPDYVVPVDELVVFKRHTDRVRTADPVALQRRKALRIAAVLGSDASPVQLCSGQETWLDISVGTTTMTCDFSGQAPQARRRLQAVAFTRQGGGGVAQIDTGSGLQGGPIVSSGTIAVSAPTCTGTEKLTWNGLAFQCATDQIGSGGTVTAVDSGPGLTGGPITTSGALSVNAPTCTGTDKLTWSGSAFTCTSDQNSGGTVISVNSGAGLAGGPITTTGTLSVNAPTCAGSDKLTWTGSAFQCATDQTGGANVSSFVSDRVQHSSTTTQDVDTTFTTSFTPETITIRFELSINGGPFKATGTALYDGIDLKATIDGVTGNFTGQPPFVYDGACRSVTLSVLSVSPTTFVVRATYLAPCGSGAIVAQYVAIAER